MGIWRSLARIGSCRIRSALVFVVVGMVMMMVIGKSREMSMSGVGEALLFAMYASISYIDIIFMMYVLTLPAIAYMDLADRKSVV